MSDDRTLALSQAYDLIEAGDPEGALALLEPLVAVGGEQHANPDAWWIYAHAVPEAQRALDALEQVLKLDPEYPGARDLLTTLEEQYPDLSPTAPLIPVDVAVNAGEGGAEIPLPPDASEEHEFVKRIDAAPAKQPAPEAVTSQAVSKPPPPVVQPPAAATEESRRNLLPLIIAIAAVVLVLFGVVALLNQGGQQQSSTEAPETAAVDTAALPTIPPQAVSGDAQSAANAQATAEATVAVLATLDESMTSVAEQTAEATEIAAIVSTEMTTETPDVVAVGGDATAEATADAQVEVTAAMPDAANATPEATAEVEVTEPAVQSIVATIAVTPIDLTALASTLTAGQQIAGSMLTQAAITPEATEVTVVVEVTSVQATDEVIPTETPIVSTPSPIETVSVTVETTDVGEPTADSTPTAEATAEQPEATAAPEAGNDLGLSIELLSANLPTATFPNDPIRLDLTRFGETVVVRVCASSPAGADLRDLLSGIMIEIGRQSGTITDPAVDAVGAELVDCTVDTPLRLIAAPIAAAKQFSQTGDELPFTISWVSL